MHCHLWPCKDPHWQESQVKLTLIHIQLSTETIFKDCTQEYRRDHANRSSAIGNKHFLKHFQYDSNWITLVEALNSKKTFVEMIFKWPKQIHSTTELKGEEKQNRDFNVATAARFSERVCFNMSYSNKSNLHYHSHPFLIQKHLSTVIFYLIDKKHNLLQKKIHLNTIYSLQALLISL